MTPEKTQKPPREEFEVEHHTKQLGSRRQRKLLRWRIHEASDGSITAASHGEEPSRERWGPPPPEDRAG
jgi:hypothetical protein